MSFLEVLYICLKTTLKNLDSANQRQFFWIVFLTRHPGLTWNVSKSVSTDAMNRFFFLESLILAQDERWRYALHMQVVRGFLTQVADGWVTRKNLPLGGG